MYLSSFGQLDADCFVKVKKQHAEETKSIDFGDYSNIDSLNKYNEESRFDSLEAITDRTLKRVTKCKYPISYLRTSENKKIITNQIRSKFTLINFNYFFCDACIQQLDDYVTIKKELKDMVTILVFFPEKQKDIQLIIDKYRTFMEFIPDKKKYIEDYNLGVGTPLNLVLDKHQNVKYASCGANQKSGLLYIELIPHLK
ncbi:MAG: hypothetical protein JNJ41_18075 [Bacteroidia bacterium]|nr:hypothetical protein [Bacteroidia bacterium]